MYRRRAGTRSDARDRPRGELRRDEPEHAHRDRPGFGGVRSGRHDRRRRGVAHRPGRDRAPVHRDVQPLLPPGTQVRHPMARDLGTM